MSSPATLGQVSAPSAPVALHRLFDLIDALDRPARSALELAHTRARHTVLPGAVGVGLCALACGTADALGDGDALALTGLRALLEALLVVVPTSLIAFMFLRLRVPPRAFVSAASLGLLLAGVVVGLAILWSGWV